jgi:steroid delta-isomerase-like uncharacterized protein
MHREDIELFLKERQQAQQDRDSRGMVARFAVDSVAESPTHGTIRGREAIREVYQTWFDAFPDLKYTQDDYVLDGDRLAIFFTASGTHMKAFANIPATGHHMSISGVFLLTFRDGRVVNEKRYYDSTALLLQIGVLKAKPV